MPQRLVVLINDDDWEQLHNMMALAIVNPENGRVLHKMFEGGYNQEWYRRIIREGMNKMMEEFDKKREEYTKK